jgi:hypothetical protein
MTDIFVVCPGNTQSGGPELCHQLVDTLNADTPGRASILYYPFDHIFMTAPPYRCYNVQPASRLEVKPGSTVILPETYGSLLDDFPGCRMFFWWMSVNNFYREAGATAAAKLAQIRRQVSGNLYQSEYARTFCAGSGLTHVHRLGDRLSAGYLEAIAKPPAGQRRDIVAYNPAKGLGRTAQILRVLEMGLRAAPKVIAVQGLTAPQVQQVLATVKCYIDFGEHPGKDRLPREAAAMGACVLTNTRGAAGNKVDMPIPEEFKVDDRRRGFERRAAGKIRMLLGEFEQQRRRFDPYRAMIAAEPALFAADARAAFPVKATV